MFIGQSKVQIKFGDQTSTPLPNGIEFSAPSHHYSTLPKSKIQLVNSINDSLRVQLRQMDQRLYEMQGEFQQFRGENLVDPTSGRSSFTQNIQEELISTNFHLSSLEAFNDSTDPVEHIISFYTQMSLYDISNALI
ncbi:hypothetical protein C4D60_Mb01t27830 [Musa balbisiana]|uniref:Uncharacterized protein n=1 Tax=Musa balbisiana TaxID=52838 RepID=A0A4S8JR81_MUSBA|nr:hypothetical protein C4D60_Mb01t27830 [Musa balbisiana]